MPLPSLYTLSQQYRELEFQFGTDEELNETALEAIRNTLDGLEESIEVKAQNVGAYILNLEAWAVATKEASKKLDGRSKRIQRRADVMREYIRLAMVAVDRKKIEGEELTLTRKSNPPVVIIEPDTEIPEQYRQTPDPLIERVIAAARELASANEFEVVTMEQLRQVLTQCLPVSDPDKKVIGALLKAERDAYQAAVELAQKRGEKMPVPPISALPGCRLEQGERLDIRP